MIEVFKYTESRFKDTGVLAGDDSIWIPLCPPWWDLASWFWWWLAPVDRKAWMTLKLRDGTTVRTRALRIARGYIRIGTVDRRP